MNGNETTKTGASDRRTETSPLPGVVLVFAGGEPVTRPVRAAALPLFVGRAEQCDLSINDDQLSRRHAEVRYLGGSSWSVTDLGSRNGTFVNGRRVDGTVRVDADAVVRLGASALLLEKDISRFSFNTVTVTDRVTGPGMREALNLLALAASTGATALVIGESGTGKEHAARIYHARSPNSRGPFVAVNCAAIPKPGFRSGGVSCLAA